MTFTRFRTATVVLMLTICLLSAAAPCAAEESLTGFAPYDAVISEYTRAISMTADEFAVSYSWDSSLNYMMLEYYHWFDGMTFAYALHDVNGDGTPELLFSDTQSVIDLYTLRDGQAV